MLQTIGARAQHGGFDLEGYRLIGKHAPQGKQVHQCGFLHVPFFLATGSKVQA